MPFAPGCAWRWSSADIVNREAVKASPRRRVKEIFVSPIIDAPSADLSLPIDVPPGGVGDYADDEALTVAEVALWLRIFKNKVFDLIRVGDIESFTIGRSRRILARDVRAYIAQRKENS
jgi:excisionase family DNA binding protein